MTKEQSGSLAGGDGLAVSPDNPTAGHDDPTHGRDGREAGNHPVPAREGRHASEAPFRVAVFASGSGSNFQAIVDRVQAGELDVKLELLVCDRPGARVIERATAAGVDTYVFRPKHYPDRESYEREIADELKRRNVDLVVLAGFMRILTPVLVDAFAGRMINIHPALLPSFKGARGIADALAYGVKVTGVTVHYVTLDMDAGPIIAQQAVPVLEGDTEHSLADRIHAAEHRLLPQVIGWIKDGRVTIEGNRTRIHHPEA
jgi:phosphoribosylglycinamide formyltransferase-1